MLDQTAPRVLAAPMLVAGVVVASTGFVLAGRRVSRTRYRADRWRPAEVVVAVSGLLVAASAWWVNAYQPSIAYPGLDRWPEVSLVGLLGVLVGLVPAVAAPLPTSALRAEVAV